MINVLIIMCKNQFNPFFQIKTIFNLIIDCILEIIKILKKATFDELKKIKLRNVERKKKPCDVPCNFCSGDKGYRITTPNLQDISSYALR